MAQSRRRLEMGGEMTHIANLFVLLIGYFDAVSTEYLIGTGYCHEGNPLMEPLVGTPIFVLAKFVVHTVWFLVAYCLLRAYPEMKFVKFAVWVTFVCYLFILLNNGYMLIVVGGLQ